MADGMQGVSGDIPPLSRHDRILYEQEYRKGVDLFQRALTEYEKADEIHKKEAFRDVMDQAMRVLNETARELKRTDLLKQNEQIAQSLQGIERETETTELSRELKQAKKTV